MTGNRSLEIEDKFKGIKEPSYQKEQGKMGMIEQYGNTAGKQDIQKNFVLARGISISVKSDYSG